MKYFSIVSPDELRTLPTSEAGSALLRAMESWGQIHVGAGLSGARMAHHKNHEPDIPFLEERLSDAWAWLEAHALLGPHPMDPAARRITTRGRLVLEEPNGFRRVVADDALTMGLHSALAKVRPIFATGDYETAAFAAMKQIEVRVRDLAGFDNSTIGVDLMRQAFRPEGPLADTQAESGENVAAMELFAGAIGSFKNPPSHRTVDYEDPTEAAEVVMLADLLMRILDRVESRLDVRNDA